MDDDHPVVLERVPPFSQTYCGVTSFPASPTETHFLQLFTTENLNTLRYRSILTLRYRSILFRRYATTKPHLLGKQGPSQIVERGRDILRYDRSYSSLPVLVCHVPAVLSS